MNKSSFFQKLAVCSWSLKPENPADLVEMLRQIGISKIQLALGPIAYDKAWVEVKKKLSDAEIIVVSGMFGTKGEDYTTLETIRATGGVVPDETWEDNWQNILKLIPIAKSLEINLVSFHAGFLPESLQDPSYNKLLNRLKKIAEAFALQGIDLAFETGQEEATTLKDFLMHLDAPNVGVNFDPANMILYGKGDPVEAVQILSGFIKQVHIKDAVPASTPGVWGEEKEVGAGDVNWSAFFQTLAEGNYRGYFCIEREAGNQRIKDIITAKRHLLNSLT